jgi:hypothetical protein
VTHHPSQTNATVDTTAVIVNYGTPDLTRAAAWSLRSLYRDLPIVIVDNPSSHDSRSELAALGKEVGGVTLMTPAENLHHGPGLDYALHRVTTSWVLTFDSDCIAYRRGFLEGMRSAADADRDSYMVGQLHLVDSSGFDIAAGSIEAHAYIHPKCALVRREAYLVLPPFERHGAPCLANERAAAAEGLSLLDFPVRDYVYHLGEGTVRRFGYGLGAASRLARLRRVLRRAW